jgi:hypothetical protein
MFASVRRFVSALPFLLLALRAAGAAEPAVVLSIDASKAGAKIDRNLFGKFA